MRNKTLMILFGSMLLSGCVVRPLHVDDDADHHTGGYYDHDDHDRRDHRHDHGDDDD